MEALATGSGPTEQADRSVSSLGGTNHVWASYFMETMGLADKVTWVGIGNVDTMLGTLKTKQVDVLVDRHRS